LVEVPYVDTAPAFEDEIIHKGEYMIHVRWNPYLNSHEAEVYKVKAVGTKTAYSHVGSTAGKSKALCLNEAEMLITD
tara:strand:- start:964 stop:1194 length:231 start_codon:yes stop_codon:yes gene_type:complete